MNPCVLNEFGHFCSPFPIVIISNFKFQPDAGMRNIGQIRIQI